jgi:hypothetical protein
LKRLKSCASSWCLSHLIPPISRRAFYNGRDDRWLYSLPCPSHVWRSPRHFLIPLLMWMAVAMMAR